MRLTDAQVKQFDEDGYLFFPELLPHAEIVAAMNEVPRLVELDRPEVIFEKDQATVRSLMNVHTFCEPVDQLIRHLAIIKPVEQILDSKTYIFQCILNLKRAFTGDIWQWHQDLPTYLVDENVPGDRLVNVLIFMEEVTEFNGPLMIVPGSHKETAHVREADDTTTSYPIRALDQETLARMVKSRGIVAPKGPPGSVIIAHTNFVHGSGPNMSPYGRAVISLTLNSIHNKHSKSRRPAWIVMDDFTPVVARQ